MDTGFSSFSRMLSLFESIIILVVVYLLIRKLFSWVAKYSVRQATRVRRVMAYALTVMFLPLFLIMGYIVWSGLDPNRRMCGGWMDAPSYACGWEDYVEEQLFWGFMVFSLPMLVWIIAVARAFHVAWRKHHPTISIPPDHTKLSGTHDQREGSKRG